MATITRGDIAKSALIEAAERLIAVHGLGHVSHRQLAAAANQRNVSVVNYHFGNMDGVLLAVLERRMAVINSRRQQLVELVLQDEATENLCRLAEVFVIPLLEFVESGKGDSYYARFLAQLENDPRRKPWEMGEGLLVGSAFRQYEQFAGPVKWVVTAIKDKLLQTQPEELAELHVNIAFTALMKALADREFYLAVEHRDRPDGLTSEVFEQALINVFVGILDPHTSGDSATTRKRIADLNTQSDKIQESAGTFHSIERN